MKSNWRNDIYNPQLDRNLVSVLCNRFRERYRFLGGEEITQFIVGSSLYSMGNPRISICNLLMQHPALRPTCGAIDCDSIMNKWSPGNSVITTTRLQDSSLPTQNSEEPEEIFEFGIPN